VSAAASAETGSGAAGATSVSDNAAAPEAGVSTSGAERGAVIRGVCARLRGSVSMGLPSDHLILRVATLPAESPDELSGMVQLQVDKFSPFPVDKMVVSHEVLARRDLGFVVLMAAAPEEDVAVRYRELDSCGIRPSIVDACVLGRWQTLVDAGAIATQGRQVAILLEADRPELIVAQDGLPILFRQLGAIGDLGPDEQAEELVRETTYALTSIEIEHGGGEIISVCIVGGGEVLQTVRQAFSREFPAATLTATFSELPSVAIGLARRLASRREGGVDLVPAVFRQMGSARAFRRRLLHTALGVVAVWLAMVAAVGGYVWFERAQLASLTAKREVWRQPALDVRTMRKRVAVIKRYLDHSFSVLECMREIVSNQPQGIDITSFSYIKRESQVSVSGEGVNVDVVYAFKTAMDGSEMFKRGKSTLTGPNFDGRRNRYKFDLKLSLPAAPGGGL